MVTSYLASTHQFESREGWSWVLCSVLTGLGHSGTWRPVVQSVLWMLSKQCYGEPYGEPFSSTLPTSMGTRNTLPQHSGSMKDVHVDSTAAAVNMPSPTCVISCFIMWSPCKCVYCETEELTTLQTPVSLLSNQLLLLHHIHTSNYFKSVDISEVDDNLIPFCSFIPEKSEGNIYSRQLNSLL